MNFAALPMPWPGKPTFCSDRSKFALDIFNQTNSASARQATWLYPTPIELVNNVMCFKFDPAFYYEQSIGAQLLSKPLPCFRHNQPVGLDSTHASKAFQLQQTSILLLLER
jgi:hypothetical protein